MSTKYLGGRKYVIFCAQRGIESTGVSRPLISMKIIMKKNITNIACCELSEKLATVRLNPEMVRMKSAEPRRISHMLPAGARPYTSQAISIAANSTKRPTSQ